MLQHQTCSSVGSTLLTLQDTALHLFITKLGYCVDLISTGNHPLGRKHNLLINKKVSLGDFKKMAVLQEAN